MPKITEAELKKQIKSRQFSPIYIFYGTEQMYVRSYTKMLVEAVAGREPSDFGFHKFSGEVDLLELAAAIHVAPFMSEFNCVLVTDIFLDSMREDEIKTFKEICAQTVDGTVLIISMPSNIPSAKKTAFDAIVKKAEKSGSVCEFKKSDAVTAEKFIAKWANENDKMISRVAANKLMSLCGDDLTRLRNEVDKICAYSSGEEVSLDDINKLATVNLESRIFDLSDAVIAGNGQKAFNVLDLLFYQKEEPISMLYALSNSYIDAYRMRVADECGVVKNEVAQDFGYGKRTFILDKVRRSTSRVSTEALRKSIEILTDADLKFKSVKINPRLYLEQVIAQLLLAAKEGRR